MSGGVDAGALARSVEQLRGADLVSGELQASLRAVAEATALVFGADGAGVMLLDDQQALHYVGATDGRAAALEAAQEETGEGPCVDSLVHGLNVMTADLAADERWPRLTEQIGALGIRAILGVPLRIGRSPVGSLNVYRVEATEWHPADVRAIEAHGRIVEEVLATAMLAQQRSTIVDQLNVALSHRVTIERAIGVVMGIADLDPVRAFNELRQVARSRRIRVGDLASEVVATRRRPSLTPPIAGAAVQVALEGEIDLAVRERVAASIEAGVDQAIAEGASLEVDLAAVTFMDSAGLAVLAVAARRLEGAGRELHVRRAPTHVLRLLEITGLEHLVGHEG